MPSDNNMGEINPDIYTMNWAKAEMRLQHRPDEKDTERKRHAVSHWFVKNRIINLNVM